MQELQADIEDHVGNLDYINKTGAELVAKAPSDEKVEKLEHELKRLNTRWGTITTAVDERVDTLETALEQLQQYQVSTQLQQYQVSTELQQYQMSTRLQQYQVSTQLQQYQVSTQLQQYQVSNSIIKVVLSLRLSHFFAIIQWPFVVY